ncbi:MAG: CoA pyrophosphatase [Alphaproteobacteria bacterium]
MTLAQLEQAFAAQNGARVPCVRGDADLNPGMHPNPATPPDMLTPAAVLVPVLRRDDEDMVLFTVRHRRLKRHAGQISFPGGRMDPDDRDAVATALRETHEEIGLPPEAVRVLGALDCYVTRTGYRVTPVVGVIEVPPALVLCDDEVEEAFEVPLSYVLDPRNQMRETWDGDGRRGQFYAIRFGARYIWGATAGMLVSLGQFVRGGGWLR